MIFCLSHRQELSTRSGWQLVYGMLVLLLLLACESDLTQLVESRHNVLDSPSTLGIRVRSPLAWGRNSVRELRAQRRHVRAHAFTLFRMHGVSGMKDPASQDLGSQAVPHP